MFVADERKRQALPIPALWKQPEVKARPRHAWSWLTQHHQAAGVIESAAVWMKHEFSVKISQFEFD